MGHKRGGKQNQRPKQIQPTVDDYDVKARLKRINRYGGKEFSSTQDIVQENRSNISYDSSSQNNQDFLSDSFVTSKDLMQFSDKNNDAHNDLRRELEGKINSVKGELEHQLNAVKESRKWWLNILIPIITTIIVGVIGYFVSATIKEDIRAIETTIDEMLKPTVYELKEDLKDLTRNFYTNNRNAEVDKNIDSNEISSQK